METKKSIFYLVLTLLILSSASPQTIAQKKQRTRLKAYYEKLDNNDKKISIKLTQGKGKKIRGVQGADISLTTYELDEEINLASFKTDSLGEAILLVDSEYPFPKDEEGYAVIMTRYKGNDSLKAAKKQIKFMDLNIEISFDFADSIKVLAVSTFKLDSIGNREPIEGIDLNIGVERLFSTLYLEEIESDENGLATMEFPNSIPGDSIGKLNIVAKVDDHRDYGTIIKTKPINWGTKVDYSNIPNERSLFGDEAPLWMIISLFIILAGAWFHFFLAVLKIWKMRKLGHN
ncbi:MAG: hypothetical protein JXR07_08105 [Reichenbachiella sp.]